MTENLSVFLAFSAGVLAFLSPCVLPLIPSWLFVIGGSPMTRDNYKRPKPVIRTVSFIFGFSMVFIVLSIIFTVTFNLMSGLFRYINIAAGLIVIILGLNIIFNFFFFFYFEKRFNIKNILSGITGAFLLGAAFGAGWTPCIGPVLTGILILAAQSGGIPRAVIYLVFFSAGLGLPFIMAAFFLDVFIKLSKKIHKYLPLIQRICGVLLILTGVLIITGHYKEFSAFAARWHL
jgi:cytochrome c-type biogenesis protein